MAWTSLAGRVAISLGAMLSLLLVINIVYQAYDQVQQRHTFDIDIVHGTTRAILHHLDAGDGIDLRRRDSLDYFTRPEAPLNAFRILDAARPEPLVSGGNPETLTRVAAFVGYDAQRTVSEVAEVVLDGREMIWGMLRHDVAGREVIVEVAIDRETKGLARDALMGEILGDLRSTWLPSIILAILLVFVGVRSGLAPLARARDKLKQSDPLAAMPGFVDDETPDELRSFFADLKGAFDRHSAVLRAQQEFVRRAAHELRTPLTLMALDLASIDDDRAREVEADVHDLAGKIANMLAWARMDADADITREPVDLERIARRVADGLLPLSDLRGTDINIEAAPQAHCLGDAASIEEAVRNLVENAIRHTPPGSSVTVRCGPNATLVVEDDGPGFGDTPPDLLCRPFWKGKKDTDGSGLGLALVKRIVERHGAQLSFESAASGGGRVKISFQAFVEQSI